MTTTKSNEAALAKINMLNLALSYQRNVAYVSLCAGFLASIQFDIKNSNYDNAKKEITSFITELNDCVEDSFNVLFKAHIDELENEIIWLNSDIRPGAKLDPLAYLDKFE